MAVQVSLPSGSTNVVANADAEAEAAIPPVPVLSLECQLWSVMRAERSETTFSPLPDSDWCLNNWLNLPHLNPAQTEPLLAGDFDDDDDITILDVAYSIQEERRYVGFGFDV
ncbi:hypothetical protein BT96DRAFT_936400 [Gymnopus androsaceus JB14]|uniref:Uncharacterized protein n=1 Tax=Gymnopus androsaceus JB14 TaxID=1447944 RepID=A0A6A4HWA7_9AGAR|nr:hypothetical protein BT96DRAFT_936400 [Gymnopus androsaceus JB14]